MNLIPGTLSAPVHKSSGPSRTDYYPDCVFVTAASDKDASLDLELKILENGQLVYKQAREFGGR